MEGGGSLVKVQGWQDKDRCLRGAWWSAENNKSKRRRRGIDTGSGQRIAGLGFFTVSSGTKVCKQDERKKNNWSRRRGCKTWEHNEKDTGRGVDGRTKAVGGVVIHWRLTVSMVRPRMTRNDAAAVRTVSGKAMEGREERMEETLWSDDFMHWRREEQVFFMKNHEAGCREVFAGVRRFGGGATRGATVDRRESATGCTLWTSPRKRVKTGLVYRESRSSEKWPQKANKMMFFYWFSKIITSERHVALLPTLVGLWDCLRPLEERDGGILMGATGCGAYNLGNAGKISPQSRRHGLGSDHGVSRHSSVPVSASYFKMPGMRWWRLSRPWSWRLLKEVVFAELATTGQGLEVVDHRTSRGGWEQGCCVMHVPEDNFQACSKRESRSGLCRQCGNLGRWHGNENKEAGGRRRKCDARLSMATRNCALQNSVMRIGAMKFFEDGLGSCGCAGTQTLKLS